MEYEKKKGNEMEYEIARFETLFFFRPRGQNILSDPGLEYKTRFWHSHIPSASPPLYIAPSSRVSTLAHIHPGLIPYSICKPAAIHSFQYASIDPGTYASGASPHIPSASPPLYIAPSSRASTLAHIHPGPHPIFNLQAGRYT